MRKLSAYIIKCYRTARQIALFVSLAAMSVLAACTSETYETGDGAYSYYRSDFCEATTDADRNISSYTTDDGIVFTLSEPVVPWWANEADSTYRVLINSNVSDVSDGRGAARMVSSQTVLVLTPRPSKQFTEFKTDPVTFESAWMSANGRYLNLGFLVKTGTVNGEYSPQGIGLLDAGTTTAADGKTCRNLVLYHAQADAPEYYSSKSYASIPTAGLQADSVKITINSYNGLVERTFAVPAHNN